MEKFYITPEIEFIEINVEKGFQTSKPGGELEEDEETEE